MLAGGRGEAGGLEVKLDQGFGVVVDGPAQPTIDDALGPAAEDRNARADVHRKEIKGPRPGAIGKEDAHLVGHDGAPQVQL